MEHLQAAQRHHQSDPQAPFKRFFRVKLAAKMGRRQEQCAECRISAEQEGESGQSGYREGELGKGAGVMRSAPPARPSPFADCVPPIAGALLPGHGVAGRRVPNDAGY